MSSTFCGFDALDRVQDDLQRALEELHLAGGVEEVAGVEPAGDVLAGVPQPGRDAAGAVAEFQEQVRLPFRFARSCLSVTR